jgi:hypothetical protein
VVGDWVIVEEPRAFQKGNYMTQVKDPSSRTVRWMFFPLTKIEFGMISGRRASL